MLNKNVLLNILTGVIKTGDEKFACRLHMFSSPENESGEGEKKCEGREENSKVQLIYALTS